MPARFTYSRWDGTQQGFELDADALFDQLTDELLYHGDVNAALRRMMQQGLRDRDGERLAGVRELLDRLRQERQQRLDRPTSAACTTRSPASSTTSSTRSGTPSTTPGAAPSAAPTSAGAETGRAAADERDLRLDLLPNDLAGKVRELEAYDFESAEAAQRFEQLMDRLRAAAHAAAGRPDERRDAEA